VRVFLDTNVLVAAFATRGLCADVVRTVLAEHELLTGEVNLTELRRALRTRLKVSAQVIKTAEELLRAQTVVGRPRKPADVPVRDADDAWVLASAVACHADILVTGDADLLEIEEPPLPILTPRQLWEHLQTEGSGGR
jgi:putative PIN family toxin of toxin-antitoxin system